MAASEDVLIERAADSLEFLESTGGGKRVQAQVIRDLAAEVRELRKDKARLDWLLNHSLPISVRLGVDDWHVIENREDIDEAMGGREGEA